MAPRPSKGMTGCALESPEENRTGRINSSGKKLPVGYSILPVDTGIAWKNCELTPFRRPRHISSTQFQCPPEELSTPLEVFTGRIGFFLWNGPEEWILPVRFSSGDSSAQPVIPFLGRGAICPKLARMHIHLHYTYMYMFGSGIAWKKPNAGSSAGSFFLPVCSSTCRNCVEERTQSTGPARNVQVRCLPRTNLGLKGVALTELSAPAVNKRWVPSWRELKCVQRPR